jgi:predicted nuclease of predicted toxin-antitoxin system
MPDRISFYFDQHVQAAVARGLGRRGVRVLAAQEAGRCGHSDLEQLEFAQANGYVLVTFDSDFLVLAAKGVQHAGIVFCKATKYSIGELIYALLLVHDVLSPGEMKNHVEFL